jgi:Leucine-rich repeat (LRR) protein
VQYKTTCENEGYSNSKKQLTIHSVNNQSESNGFFAKGGKICSIFGWNSLDSVWFGNSSFEEIPDGLVRSKLLSINVSFAGLLRVKPEDFSNGQNLKELDLSHNQLKVLENKLFSNLTGLIKLDASFNQINFIHPEAFKNCCKFLTVLELQHNKILKIDSGIFKLLQSNFYHTSYEYHRHTYQQKVDVSYNQLTELEIRKNVVNLNAANNKIKRLF